MSAAHDDEAKPNVVTIQIDGATEDSGQRNIFSGMRRPTRVDKNIGGLIDVDSSNRSLGHLVRKRKPLKKSHRRKKVKSQTPPVTDEDSLTSEDLEEQLYKLPDKPSISEPKPTEVKIQVTKKASKTLQPTFMSRRISTVPVTGKRRNTMIPVNKTSKESARRKAKRKTAQSRWNKIKLSVRKGHQKKVLSLSDSFLQRFSFHHAGREYNGKHATPRLSNISIKEGTLSSHRYNAYVISPEGNVMYGWLFIITLSVVYNLWTAIAREAFTDIMIGYETFWYATDIFADLIYLADIAVQMRTAYLEMGLVVCGTRSLLNHYTSSSKFIVDLIALTPLDLLQFYIGIHPIVRFPRFFKIYRTYQFMYIVGMRSVYPNLWRVVNLTHVLFLASHWFAAFYYMISRAENYVGGWSYPPPVDAYASVWRKYLKSMYWATLTLTTIGDLPSPESNIE